MSKRRKRDKKKRTPGQHPGQTVVSPDAGQSEKQPKGEAMHDMEDSNANTNPPIGTEELESVEGHEEVQVQTDIMESFSRLEKVIRGMARDNLSIVRNQRENQTALQGIQERIVELELTTKGFSQTVWRATQENQEQIQKAENHFASAVRELEARVREEIKIQLLKNTLQSIFPALDDLDLVIGNQKALSKTDDQEDGLLGAMILVRRKLVDGLTTLGLKEIAIEEGATQFDPGLHEAIEPDIAADLLVDNDLQSGTIVRVRRAGYYFNERIFRVPQVIIKMDKS